MSLFPGNSRCLYRVGGMKKAMEKAPTIDKNSSLQLELTRSSPEYSAEIDQALSRSSLCLHLYAIFCDDIKLYEFFIPYT